MKKMKTEERERKEEEEEKKKKKKKRRRRRRKEERRRNQCFDKMSVEMSVHKRNVGTTQLITIIIILCMAPHLVRAQSACKAIRISSQSVKPP